MNIDYLKTFLSLADNGSFTKTAQALFVSQSTVSIRIKELEKELGKELFRRSYGACEMTMAGHALLDYAKQIVELEACAMKQVGMSSTFSDHLQVGSVFYYYDSFLAHHLEDSLVQCPNLAVRMILLHSRNILQRLKADQLDVGFTHHPLDSPEYICNALPSDSMLLVTGAQNRIHAQGLCIQDIKHLPILYSSYLDKTTEHWLFPAQHHFPLDIDVGVKILPFLTRGERYTFLPQKLVERELASGTLLSVPLLGESLPPLDNYLIYKKESKKKEGIEQWVHWFQAASTPSTVAS
ncbi:hypothetical protein ABB02_01213 [Clostridiaceae bacterium JG1575]|nr:hypothetical protein ABB02_01213 [Clostridiaceae bacterium JG1575]